MSSSQKVTILGSVSLGPPYPSSGTFPSLSQQVSLQADQTRSISRGTGRPINSPAAYIDLLASLGLGTATHVTLRISGGSLTLRFTTPDGADQLLRCSKLFVWDSPSAGSGMTALAVQGVADIEIIVAGDPP